MSPNPFESPRATPRPKRAPRSKKTDGLHEDGDSAQHAIIQPESFKAVEQRIALTRERLPNFPYRRSTITRLIAHLAKQIQTSCNLALKPHQLNYVTYNTLMMMYGAPDYTINPSDLSAATGEKPANCTRICDELEARGLIERHAALDDRRRVVLKLTDIGRELVEQAQPAMWQHMDRFFSHIDSQQIDDITHLLKLTLASIEQASP